jgi:hypothetical protein
MDISKSQSEEVSSEYSRDIGEQPTNLSKVTKRVANNASDNKYLSLRQTIARFDVSRTTLFRWHKELGLPVSHVRGRIFYRIADIQELIEKHFKDPRSQEEE